MVKRNARCTCLSPVISRRTRICQSGLRWVLKALHGEIMAGDEGVPRTADGLQLQEEPHRKPRQDFPNQLYWLPSGAKFWVDEGVILVKGVHLVLKLVEPQNNAGTKGVDLRKLLDI
ncbi:hypothetical protein PIB30_003124 [Stylosanthes scabra]|uniref:Uncharacterized protein n=1 Tax=Stylosanthes scabra TaxID=79078 RepID=A0ABU6Y267_9FABA|nr:hypothetical protein [Stylosanthes scabra]